MALKMMYYGNKILRKRADLVKTFDENLHGLIQEMTHVLHAHQGIGLAAPQVGISQRLFLVQIPVEVQPDTYESGSLQVFINPEILEYSQETWSMEEGCLSIPKLRGPVTRPLTITVRAQDAQGNLFTKQSEGLEARCILHENDHLNGVLYIDRVHKKWRTAHEQQLRKIKQQHARD